MNLSASHLQVRLRPLSHRLTLNHQSGSIAVPNARYIDGFRRSRAYIVQEGRDDADPSVFWRMVWETRTGVMVQMATRSDVEKEEEGNGKRVRCVQYFL